MRDIDKIKELIQLKKFDEANILIKKSFKSEGLGDPSRLEELFSVLITARPVLRHFLKFLKISKVPPIPIDTKFDSGRRFFYALYIINNFGGRRFLAPYIENITVSRPLEFRYLGGIHFFNMNYNKAKESYLNAYSMLPKEYDEFKHLFIIGNLAFCYLHGDEYDEYEALKQESYQISGNHPSIKRIFEKYDVFKFIHKKEYSNAFGQYEHCKSKGYYAVTINKTEVLHTECYMSAINKDIAEFKVNLSKLVDHHIINIKNNDSTPERLIGTINYISSITIHAPKTWKDIFDIENVIYPMEELKIRKKTVPAQGFTSLGKETAENYINFETEEFKINQKKGIGLNTEIKSIYWILRSHKYGISFETLASLIYETTDYAGLFLIRERIKQVVNRLITHYKIKLKVSMHRVYIDQNEVEKFHIKSKGKLLISSGFSIYDFMNFYDVSQSKAQKIINKFLDKKDIQKSIVGKKNIYTIP